jgi:predicted nucleic acid-binding protein
MKPEKLEQSKRFHAAKYFLDANVFLEVELEHEKADVCEKFLENFISENLKVYS